MGRRLRVTGETIGRLQVRTPTLFDGYLNRPDATAESFDADGWYRTGDVACVDDAGMHQIVGRVKSGRSDQVRRIPGGVQVKWRPCCWSHAGVSEAAVVGIPDADLGQRIVAFVVGDAAPGRSDFFCRPAAFGAQAAARGAIGRLAATQCDGQGGQEGTDGLRLACSASLRVIPVPARLTTSTAPVDELRRNRRLSAQRVRGL